MHGNKTQFERNSSLQYYHVTCIWENKTKLVVGNVRILKLAKPNGDCVTEKSLVTGHSSAIAEHVTSTPGGKTPHMKRVGMLVGNFQLNP